VAHAVDLAPEVRISLAEIELNQSRRSRIDLANRRREVRGKNEPFSEAKSQRNSSLFGRRTPTAGGKEQGLP
jgi:hypothetical protein